MVEQNVDFHLYSYEHEKKLQLILKLILLYDKSNDKISHSFSICPKLKLKFNIL
jgi:hypothetical protein